MQIDLKTKKGHADEIAFPVARAAVEMADPTAVIAASFTFAGMRPIAFCLMLLCCLPLTATFGQSGFSVFIGGNLSFTNPLSDFQSGGYSDFTLEYSRSKPGWNLGAGVRYDYWSNWFGLGGGLEFKKINNSIAYRQFEKKSNLTVSNSFPELWSEQTGTYTVNALFINLPVLIQFRLFGKALSNLTLGTGIEITKVINKKSKNTYEFTRYVNANLDYPKILTPPQTGKGESRLNDFRLHSSLRVEAGWRINEHQKIMLHWSYSLSPVKFQDTFGLYYWELQFHYQPDWKEEN